MKTESVAWIVVIIAAVAFISFWVLGSSGGINTESPLAVVPTDTKGSNQVSLPTNPVVNKGGSTTSAPSKTATSAPVSKPQITGLLSINHLLNLVNVSYTCSFTVASPYRVGTFDLVGNKWRGDFGNNVSMINDGKSIYVWTKGESEGLKVPAASGVVGESLRRVGAIDAFTPLAYKCVVSSPDSSRFTPPDLLYKNSEGQPYL
jgi:hypothetical protein